MLPYGSTRQGLIARVPSSYCGRTLRHAVGVNTVWAIQGADPRDGVPACRFIV
jgi:hypothetical protein